MQTKEGEISVKGKAVKVPVVSIDGRTVIFNGRWLKFATIHDEEWLDGEPIKQPGRYVDALRNHQSKPDIFSFAAAEPESEPRFSGHIEWDNVAVIRTESYANWWKSLSQESRRNVRIAEKRGATVKVVPFDDKLVAGIKGIYDETPVRQGRRFWHYGKDFETVKKENSTYLERSEFIGAFVNDELIGFIKMVYIGKMARIMQILSKNQHFDKRPANAMIAKAVEVCSQKGMSYFAYCRYVYGNKRNSSVTEFKRRNGFEEFRFPRYYFPLTLKGRIALRLGLHLGVRNWIPEPVVEKLLAIRAWSYAKFSAQAASGPGVRPSNEQPAAVVD